MRVLLVASSLFWALLRYYFSLRGHRMRKQFIAELLALLANCLEAPRQWILPRSGWACAFPCLARGNSKPYICTGPLAPTVHLGVGVPRYPATLGLSPPHSYPPDTRWLVVSSDLELP